MEEEYYYRIMDYENGNIKTLFHALNGSRTVPMFQWLQAKVAEVSDGKNGTKYTSGWHVYDNHNECMKYLRIFKNIKKKVIVRCKVKGTLRWKVHSKSNVQLAEYIYITGLTGKGLI